MSFSTIKFLFRCVNIVQINLLRLHFVLHLLSSVFHSKLKTCLFHKPFQPQTPTPICHRFLAASNFHVLNGFFLVSHFMHFWFKVSCSRLPNRLLSAIKRMLFVLYRIDRSINQSINKSINQWFIKQLTNRNRIQYTI